MTTSCCGVNPELLGVRVHVPPRRGNNRLLSIGTRINLPRPPRLATAQAAGANSWLGIVVRILFHGSNLTLPAVCSGFCLRGVGTLASCGRRVEDGGDGAGLGVRALRVRMHFPMHMWVRARSKIAARPSPFPVHGLWFHPPFTAKRFSRGDGCSEGESGS